jgi:hypothetical protein
MNFFREGLTPQQSEVLSQMGAQMADRGFYLAGGTALTICLAHRRSVDLDWFSPQPMHDPFLLAQSLRDAGIPLLTSQTAPGTLHGQIGSVRVSFLEFRYPMLQPVKHWPEYGCDLASLDDLACMKLSAIAQRGSKKDFFDIHALVLRHRPLAEMLPLYRQKFSVTDLSPVLYGLVYFDDAEEEPAPALLRQVGWRTVKKDITGWLKEIVG